MYLSTMFINSIRASSAIEIELILLDFNLERDLRQHVTCYDLRCKVSNYRAFFNA